MWCHTFLGDTGPIYMFHQTPSLRVRERGLGMRLRLAWVVAHALVLLFWSMRGVAAIYALRHKPLVVLSWVWEYDLTIAYYTIYNEKYFSDDHFSYPYHYMIRILDVPGCYESAARTERKSALQGSGLVIETHYLTICVKVLREACAAKQALATKPRARREVRSIPCHTYQ